MGRPIKKRRLGNTPGSIAVTNARFLTGGVQTDNENGVRIYLKRQKGTKRFLVETSNGTYSQVLKLVGKATPAPGEFNIAVQVGDLIGGSDGSTIYWAVKIKNRTVDVQADNDPTTLKTLKYTLQSEGSDEENLTSSGIANIDVL